MDNDSEIANDGYVSPMPDGSEDEEMASSSVADQSDSGQANEENGASVDGEERDSGVSPLPDGSAKGDDGAEENADKEGSEGAADDSKSEPTYSTRGRASDKDQDALDRLIRDGHGELEREKPAPSSASFLSDTLTEEERRTRTRFLPDVDGMNTLRKHEVKSDLSLARAFNTSGSKRSKRNDDAMDIDERHSPIEDTNDANRRVLEFDGKELNVPSAAFVAPSQVSDGAGRNPRLIGTTAAFNPPHPPESVGAKKAHRMARWENRPADIQIDLNNYRKTVQRTREELYGAMAEKERIENTQDHMRRHLLQHIECLGAEWEELNEELAEAQKECVNGADLPTSRTRSRGAGKNSNVMRDVIQVLCTRGAEMEAKSLPWNTISSEDDVPLGMGGVGLKSLQPWGGATVFEQGKSAEAWLLPGDACTTPYGSGVVESVIPANHPIANSPVANKDDMEVETASKTEDDRHGTKTDFSSKSAVCARVAVKLPFGTGYFPVGTVTTKEDPTSYDDARLALRWKGLAETAKSVGNVLDLERMARVVTDPDQEDEDEVMEEHDSAVDNNEEKEDFPTKPRDIPLGATLLPMGPTRGQNMDVQKLEDLEDALQDPLYEGEGVLGDKSNPFVTPRIREAEDRNQEVIELKSKVVHLRHKLYHQRSIRMLNGRTYDATLERVNRAEALVAEMRTDLKSLRSRLQDEVDSLGISDEAASEIVAAFYTSLGSQHTGEASPPKRARREVNSSDDDEDDGGSRTAESGTEAENSKQ